MSSYTPPLSFLFIENQEEYNSLFSFIDNQIWYENLNKRKMLNYFLKSQCKNCGYYTIRLPPNPLKCSGCGDKYV
jgi:hypothetical protein